MNRSANQLTAVYVILDLLSIANCYDWCAEYLYIQPSPTYTAKLYYEWIRPYLTNVRASLIEQKHSAETVDKHLNEALAQLTEFEEFARKQPPVHTVVTGRVAKKIEGPQIQVPGRNIWWHV